jgi:DNA invertase Pin-like site-specific DNA recombinase
VEPGSRVAELFFEGGVSGSVPFAKRMLTVLAAVAQFERTRLAQRIIEAKGELRRSGRHQGGTQRVGWRLDKITGNCGARDFVPDPIEQAAIRDISRRRADLMAIKTGMAERGRKIGHRTIADICEGARLAGAA